jgi:hypothetical protein
LYRESAASFFHEAIGDTLALSVVTPKHLHTIGLIKDKVDQSDQLVINAQMAVALSKIAILPWAYLVDVWRWKVMSGEVTPDEYQSSWIQLVEHYQGLKRPVESSEDDFDPACKFHVPSNTQYIRYFGAALVVTRKALIIVSNSNSTNHYVKHQATLAHSTNVTFTNPKKPETNSKRCSQWANLNLGKKPSK